ncbi:MAG: thymidine phosphorylase [Mariniblastus sp.]|nr:thymidine phosphorylase [Mariniblastus sp.]
MNVTQIIRKKRDGHQLEDREIEALIHGYSDGTIPDYQLSAFAMAVYFQGMTLDETVALTRSFVESGQVIRWRSGKPKVDKHSTGGIGDKTSLALTPMLACCGVDVPRISGHGLGATGGTLDKLESIDGYRCNLSIDEFQSVVYYNGCAVVSASSELAPADKKMYALRDVTATVPSAPLIASSILSKKIAEGLDVLVLDVKWGSGAFMKSVEDANALARQLVDVGKHLGVQTEALVTDMNQPLGRMIGNGVEVDEAVDVLNGGGPPDVIELALAIGIRILLAAGVQPDAASARHALQQSIELGTALEKLREMIDNQGGNLDAERHRGLGHTVTSTEEGFVNRIETDRLGLAIIEMGGGRKHIGDKIDHTVGIDFKVKIGDAVAKGQPIAEIFCHNNKAKHASSLVSASIGTLPVPTEAPKLIVDRFE